MREWDPDRYAGLRELLDGDADAYRYFRGLPAPVRAALRGRGRVSTFAEMQSVTAYEREGPRRTDAGPRGRDPLADRPVLWYDGTR